MRKSVQQITFRRWCFAALACAVFTSAAVHSQKPKVVVPSTAPPQIRFENRQTQSGIRFVLENSTTDTKPIIDSVLGGVALLDFDNDGYLDIFFTNGAQIPSLSKAHESFHNRLYRNNHDGTFSDVTARAGVAGAGYSMGAAAADFDNDGWTDLYVTGFDRNILYHNNHNATFTDVTERAGVSGRDAAGKKLWSVGAAWVDYDNDGRLDLFVANYLDWTLANARVCGETGFDSFLDYNYGRFLMKRNRLSESKKHLDRAVELAPKVRAVRYERGKLNFRLGNYAEARNDGERALSLKDPGGVIIDLQIYNLLQLIYTRLGATELARQYAELSRTTPVPLRSESPR